MQCNVGVQIHKRMIISSEIISILTQKMSEPRLIKDLLY